MEYLKIAQDLDMYGVNYFLIKVNLLSYTLREEANMGGVSALAAM